MSNEGGHDFAPITDLAARCNVCQKKFSIVCFFNTSSFPVCMGPPKPKVVTGKKAIIKLKQPDGMYKEIGTVNNIEYGLSYDTKDVYVLGKKASCECGSAKTGVADYKPGHSSWCPVKEP